MSAKRLTSAGVTRLKATDKRVEIADSQVRGLRPVVQPSGRKSWALRYRVAGKTAKFTIGTFPEFDVAEARIEGQKALKQIARGRHPLAVRHSVDAEKAEADAQRAQLKLKIAEREFIAVAEADRVWFKIQRMARERMQAIPDRVAVGLAADLGVEKAERKVRLLLGQEISTALEALSAGVKYKRDDT